MITPPTLQLEYGTLYLFNGNFVCLVQLLPRVSSLSPVTTVFPLVTVLFVTAIKDAVEDYVCLFLLLA